MVRSVRSRQYGLVDSQCAIGDFMAYDSHYTPIRFTTAEGYAAKGVCTHHQREQLHYLSEPCDTDKSIVSDTKFQRFSGTALAM